MSRGLRVLVVEDEAFVAMLLEEMLRDIGCELAAALPSVSRSLAFLRSGAAIDAAILDVNLGNETSLPVAEELRTRGIPFLFSTGYGRVRLGDKYGTTPVLQKPFQAEQLERALMWLTDKRAWFEQPK